MNYISTVQSFQLYVQTPRESYWFSHTKYSQIYIRFLYKNILTNYSQKEKLQYKIKYTILIFAQNEQY